MRLSLIVLLTALTVVLMGCSGGGGMPVTPGIPGADITDAGQPGGIRTAALPDSGNFLWGYWQGTIDLASSEIELIPMRQIEFHANLASILQNNPLGLSYKFKGFDMIEKAVDVDVTITHPYPNSNFRGFDMRGIFMGPGNTVTSKTDLGIKYPASDGTRVLNADGYSRWWNAIEFTTSGMYGYDDQTVFPDFIVPETTLNPYKYFADCLGPEDPVIPNVNSTNRGTFSTEGNPPSVTRRYRIAFPTIGGYMKFVFHYAVDVNWAKPINGHPTPKPIDDFPPEANCPEPFHIEVDTTGTTAFYKDETESGGDLQLAVEVFDWQSEQNPEGMAGEIESIWLESENLFDAIYASNLVPMAGSYPNSAIYYFNIPNVKPSGLEDQEVLITVRTQPPENSYAPPVGGPAYPEGAVLASYKLIEVPIKSIEPDAVTVISPNGGQTWGISSSPKITWSSEGEVENVKIDLSIDNGENYNIGIVAETENDGEFILPSVGNWHTEQAKIRISKVGNPDVFDESDAVFIIKPFIHVHSPNGNELIPAATTFEIKWTASSCIGSVTILLSTDAGENYLEPVSYSTANDGSFNWNNIPSSMIGSYNRIKIADTAEPNTFDTSDNNFAILPEMEDPISLISPYGGESWIAGTTREIKWAADYNIENVEIKLSMDSGATWPEIIVDTTLNDGNFEWESIPIGYISSQCRIGIYEIGGAGASDTSDTDFAIIDPTITIISPDGGESWDVGSEQAVTWTSEGQVDTVDIDLSLDGGENYTVNLATGYANTGEFPVDPVGNWPTAEAMIRVTNSAHPASSDASNEEFSIISPGITVITPNGGEIWDVGAGYTITWSSTGLIDNVNIDLSLNGGVDFDIPIATDYPDNGEYLIVAVDETWVSNQAMVRISDADGVGIPDTSNAVFTVKPSINLIAPNGFENYVVGSMTEITWDNYGAGPNVTILLSMDSGMNYDHPISYNAPNSGSFTIDAIPMDFIGTNNRIKVSDNSDPDVYDTSDDDFTILPILENMITVESPNGGEVLLEDVTYQIPWDTVPGVGDLDIRLSNDSGMSWPTVIAAGTENDGIADWHIPAGMTGNACRIGIFASGNHSIFDTSDYDFTIAPLGIQVTYPAGGEVVYMGAPTQIEWLASSSITSLKIELSLNSGADWNPENVITLGTENDGVYEWTPNTPVAVKSAHARIRIADASNPLLYNDTSDYDFVLHEGITVLNPSDGDTMKIGQGHLLEWESSPGIQFVNIRLDVDALDPFDYDPDIAVNLPNTGSAYLDYDWLKNRGLDDQTLWFEPAMTATIKVSQSGNPAVYGESTDIEIPVTLGILNSKNCSSSLDSDGDGVKDCVEDMFYVSDDHYLDKNFFDSDKDGMYDFDELFSAVSWLEYDEITNVDEDELIKALDIDDDGDGNHDGLYVDSDNDGIANFLEYFGFTYNWLSGEFGQWPPNDYTVKYFKTDPMQPSTDQDPYGDGMEVSGLLMDKSVKSPADSPMVAALPEIVIRLVGYQVTLNADIVDSDGGHMTKNTSLTHETSQSNTTGNKVSGEYNWSMTTKASMDVGPIPSGSVETSVTQGFSVGFESSWESTTGQSRSESNSQSKTIDWSTSKSYNPTEAAHIKFYLKAQNKGTACASNIVPTVTLRIGPTPIATFQPDTQINLLPAGGVYPSGAGNYWVVDKINGQPIILTENDLRELQSGGNVTVCMTQMTADVAALNDEGYWEYKGDWNEHLSRIDSVCANIYFDGGDGNPINYLVFADNSPSAPKVMLRDMLFWVGAREIEAGETDPITGYKPDHGMYTVVIDYMLPGGQPSPVPVDLRDAYFFLDGYICNQVVDLGPEYDFNLYDVNIGPDSRLIGLAPPRDLDDQKPYVIWANCEKYYDINGVIEYQVIRACVTDYYGVDDVFFKDLDGSEYTLIFNSSYGYWEKTITGSIWALNPATDFIYAIATRLDADEEKPYEVESDPYLVRNLADLPTEPPPVGPEITPATVKVTEDRWNLGISITANVVKKDFDIDTVQLVTNSGAPLCTLNGSPAGGAFTGEIADTLLAVNETEWIKAIDIEGNATLFKPSYDLPYPTDKKYSEFELYWSREGPDFPEPEHKGSIDAEGQNKGEGYQGDMDPQTDFIGETIGRLEGDGSWRAVVNRINTHDMGPHTSAFYYLGGMDGEPPDDTIPLDYIKAYDHLFDVSGAPTGFSIHDRYGDNFVYIELWEAFAFRTQEGRYGYVWVSNLFHHAPNFYTYSLYWTLRED